ncbi:MAG: DUF3467 domain-containing protein [archaeon]|nr:DUF3467 domain-containing protein [archaeon]MCP8306156.1 DUF3467 domain-containing protein [archaeon]
MGPRRQIPIKVRYSPEFKRVYCTGAVGGFNGYDFRICFYTDILTQAEDPIAAPTATRELQVEVTLAPLALKRLRNWLDKQTKEVEKLIGEIKTPEERPSPEPSGAPPYR